AMSKAGKTTNPSTSIHQSSIKPGFKSNQQKRRDMTPAPPLPNPKPEKNSHILELHAIFLMHDHRGDNKISINDLGDCLRAMGANPSEVVVSKNIRKLQDATLRRISFDECMTVYASLGKHTGRPSPQKMQIEEEHFISSLKMLDEDNTGFLPAVRLRNIFTKCGQCMSRSEADDLLMGRINSKGKVNYKKLIHDIMNG
ncbi:hypothetical protein KR009_004342, partial [Drosophila setifemur]